MSKKQAEDKINSFFSQDRLDAEEVRKIKRLAMHFKIKLKDYRRRFCKSCLHDLKEGKVRVSKTCKIVECRNCGYKNRFKIN